MAGVFYDRDDVAEAERAKAWYRDMHDTFLHHGYPTYRATTMGMPAALDQNPAAKSFLAALKQALDPKNVIAPGRYGTPTRDQD